MWRSSEDRIVKLGSDWVRVSAVEAIKKRPTDNPHSHIHLAGGGLISVPGWPDDVAKQLWPEGEAG